MLRIKPIIKCIVVDDIKKRSLLAYLRKNLLNTFFFHFLLRSYLPLRTSTTATCTVFGYDAGPAYARLRGRPTAVARI